MNIVFTSLASEENIHILAGQHQDRLGVISFYVEALHLNLGVKNLNDRFGIQTRGGCSCAGTYGHFLIHVDQQTSNELTNEILSCLSSFTLLEGIDDSCMFDVLVRNYDGENDLLIEVKSSTEKANIRMAIGQLLNYWYELKGKKTRHVAILLPEKPDEKSIQLLDSIDIGLLWFESKKLYTSTHKLNNLASLS